MPVYANTTQPASTVVAVVLPCFRTARKVCDVLSRVGPEVHRIYVVDDCCPERTGDVVAKECHDPRIVLIRHSHNQGVGGAVITGYKRALADGAHVIVKVDSDGQMNPRFIPEMIKPIIDGRADYAKGNRFFELSGLTQMPAVRLAGNAVLSLMTKLSTGYWDIFDPTNGYTAIDSRILPYLGLNKLAKRYFFETDMLYRLSTLRAVIADVPMRPAYGDETSSLRIGQVIIPFAWKHCRNLAARIFYTYFLREMTVATFALIGGAASIGFGICWGLLAWAAALRSGVPTPLGTIMLSVLPTLLGSQLLLSFIAFDVSRVPAKPVSPLLPTPESGHVP